MEAQSDVPISINTSSSPLIKPSMREFASHKRYQRLFHHIRHITLSELLAVVCLCHRRTHGAPRRSVHWFLQNEGGVSAGLCALRSEVARGTNLRMQPDAIPDKTACSPAGSMECMPPAQNKRPNLQIHGPIQLHRANHPQKIDRTHYHAARMPAANTAGSRMGRAG